MISLHKLAQWRDHPRDIRMAQRGRFGFVWLNDLIHDLRYAVRQLVKAKAFAFVAVITLAMGLSANISIYALIDNLFFAPLQVEGADRLVTVTRHNPRSQFSSRISWPDYEDYRDNVPGLSGTIALAFHAVNLSWAGQSPNRTWIEGVSTNYFTTLGTSPAVGRLFLPGEGVAEGADPIFVLSHRYWRDRLGSDPGVVGRPMRVNGQVYEVVGVASEGFNGAQWAMAPAGWVPVTMIPNLIRGLEGVLENREVPLFRVFAHMADGYTPDRVRAELAVVDRRLESEHAAGAMDGVVTMVVPEQRSRPDPSFSGFLPLAAAVFLGLSLLVLTVACANIANLLSARATGRHREWAIRSAVGASRWRLMRQQLAESMVLALLAGLVGLGTMPVIGPAIQALAPQGDIPTQEGSLQVLGLVRIVSFTVAASFLAGLLAGFLPAVRATRGNLQQLMKGEHGREKRAGRWMRGALVGSQVAFCAVVLVASGLFVRSLGRASDMQLGFDPQGIAQASIDLGLQGYEPEAALQFFDDLKREVSGLPGVQSATVATSVPLGMRPELLLVSDANATQLDESGRTEGEIEASQNRVDEAYLETMDVRLLRGRGFNRQDALDAPRVALVNTTLADKIWPGADPIGKRMKTNWGGWEQSIEVIGVIEPGKYIMLTEAPRPHFLLPLAQSFGEGSPVTLHVRTRGAPALVLPEVRRVLLGLDPDVPIYEAMTMPEHLRTSAFGLMPLRLGSVIAGAQALVGLLLALTGMFGVVAYTVSMRTSEIGIRRALGATQTNVLRLVSRGVLRAGTIGLGFGLLAALGLSQILLGLLPGMEPFDLPVFGYTTLLMTAVSLLACYIAARRAARIDPAISMRIEG